MRTKILYGIMFIIIAIVVGYIAESVNSINGLPTIVYPPPLDGVGSASFDSCIKDATVIVKTHGFNGEFTLIAIACELHRMRNDYNLYNRMR